ncbi:MAG TPA: homoserine kinase [Gemmatimonadaceae bacterium]|nr:homoserine kinase [Gemmatimonadaceae bacterium]
MTRHVHVHVPASSSNLGGGFDCVGIAVNRWLSVTAHLDPTSTVDARITRAGTLANLGVAPAEDRIVIGFRAACTYAGRVAPRGLVLRAESTIPVARGLGSSAAAAVAGAVAANGLLDLGLDQGAVLAIAAGIEGHPDNAAPAVHGGATLAIARACPDGPSAIAVRTLSVAPDVVLVLAVPELTVETIRARAVLPPTVPHEIAARAAALGAALVHGLAAGDPILLAAALDDVLHVPYRRHLVPGFDDVVDAARHAGAFGATLSGSGASVVALAPRPAAHDVARAMHSAWARHGVSAEAFESVTPSRGYRARLAHRQHPAKARIPSSIRSHAMPVTLHLPAVLAKLADRQAIETAGATVGEAVANVAGRYPALGPRLRDEAGNPYPFVTFYLNDEDIRFQGGFAAPLADGDELTIVPAIAGG